MVIVSWNRKEEMAVLFEILIHKTNSVLSSKIIKNEEFCWQVRGMLDRITLEMH